jgi:hypothetical protein
MAATVQLAGHVLQKKVAMQLQQWRSLWGDFG